MKKKTAFVAVLLITATYTIITIPEVKPYSDVKYPDYLLNVYPYLRDCQLDEIPERGSELLRAPLKWYSICASYKLGNENIIPFIFSILTLPLTYRLGYVMSGKHLVGIIAMLFVLSSVTFTRWDTSATYDQSWSLFLVTALNLLYVKPSLAPVSYLASIAGKTLAFVYMPMYLYHVVRQNGLHGIMFNLTIILTPLILITLLVINIETLLGTSLIFDYNKMFEGSWKWIFYFAEDLHIMIGTPIMLAMLWIMHKKIRNADVVFWWCVGIILTVPLIMGFTTQLIHPYRFVPFVIFYSIGMAMIINHWAQKIISKKLVNKQWTMKVSE